jgi:hypothetical protein
MKKGRPEGVPAGEDKVILRPKAAYALLLHLEGGTVESTRLKYDNEFVKIRANVRMREEEACFAAATKDGPAQALVGSKASRTRRFGSRDSRAWP